ncbi:ThuA domain-containing protein [Olivibacter sp. SDN3]|uniref:ThuA domain-containing protein n=1 Tax=Olivibacter sp. SDN3 TaxID=2764720 RepID=UPI0016511A39|nr:ThuA domain-containing protein [Olivibacter sp. SDN3]QNL50563.1 ThuA domain-containing protein [Olivibacter sp. SDN3]
MKKQIKTNWIKSLISLCFCISLSLQNAYAQKTNWEKVKILVYTKNGEGYVHDNIGSSVKAIQELGQTHGFEVTVSEDPALFNDDELKQYDALVFSNTNNDVFDTDEQRVALMRYIQAGGGFVGLHSASGTERNWKWFKQLLGATFYWHDKNQPFTVNIVDSSHLSVAHLPQKWERSGGDEFYYLKEMNVNLHVIAVNDATTLEGDNDKRLDTFGDVFPSVWCQKFDGGRSWYTSLGHNKEDYEKEDLRTHILGGISWVIGKQKGRDYGKAYAKSPQDEVKQTKY